MQSRSLSTVFHRPLWAVLAPVFALFALFTLFAVPAQARDVCTPPPANLAAWWPLDEASGTSGVTDVAGRVPARLFGDRSAVAGTVRGAQSFDGNGDYALSGDQPLLNFGAGQDFSIDFWIRTQETGGIQVVLDKRDFQGPPIGWQVFVFNGSPGLQLATGSGPAFCSFDPAAACTNYVAPFGVADGTWHFVAVTVDRDDPSGVRWYLDGNPVGPGQNPTVRQASLATSVGTQIGAGRVSGNVLAFFFTGSLDEIEVFRRVLSPSEIRDLYLAGTAGKCVHQLQVPWDTSTGCINLPATAELEICNHLDGPELFDLDFAALPAGSQVHPVYSCSADGPTQFELVDPVDDPVLVGAGACRTVKVRAGGVPAPQPFQIACYEARATPLSGGAPLTGFGSLYLTGPICCSRGADTSTTVTPGGTATTSFLAENLTGEARTFRYQLDVVDATMELDQTGVRLGDREPGEPVIGEVVIPPGETVEISTPVSLTEFERFRPFEVLLHDRDRSEPNVLVSEALRSAATGGCLDGGETNLCLNADRFEVTVSWEDFQGGTGVGRAVPLTSDTGYFWFFRDTNVELVIKALDARGVNDHWWIFYGALSNVEYTIQVRDTVTGAVRNYVNPAGRFASVGDTEAFAAGEASVATTTTVTPDELSAAAPGMGFALLPDGGDAAPGKAVTAQATCSAGPEALCLQGGRFRVEVAWEDFQGGTGAGQAEPLTSDTGYFWFFRDTNAELVVKVLDGRPVNGNWWVFYGALSNVAYEITVTDTERDRQVTLTNPSGNFGSRGETDLLPAP